MTEAMAALGAPKGEEGGLAAALPEWGPFPEVRASLEEARSRGWKLALLSNTDRDFIEASIAQIGVPFELAIVASEINSYKPRARHWLQFLEETGAPRDAHVHVAQSHYHDIVPANALGLQSIWINRYGEQREPPPTRELADLSALPATLDELVAP
jgi:2-haloacid dehalogenase